MNKANENIKLVPELRFPQFWESPEWEVKVFEEVFDRLTTKNKENNQNVLTISAQHGLVSQLEYFNKKISAKDVSGYYLLHKGDFAFNKSYSKGYPMGAIKLLKNYNKGVVSTLYICFRAKKGYSEIFFDQYFDSGIVNPEIGKIAQEGGRAHGLLNVSVKEFFKDIRILVPQPSEQQKIAATLTSLDHLIAAENEKLEALQAHKKGLLQQLFPAKGEKVPKLRFGEFSGEWEETTLGEVAKFRRGSFPQPYGLDKWYDDENGMPFIQVYDVDFNLKIKPKTKRKISQLATNKSVFIPKGTVIITIQGSIGRVAITQYDAYIDRTLLLFQEYYREIDKLFFAYVLQLLFDIEKRKAPGGIIKTITKEVLTSFIVHIPEIDEQQKIANILSSLDDRITSQSEKLEALNEHKKGLMQQMFPNLNTRRL